LDVVIAASAFLRDILTSESFNRFMTACEKSASKVLMAV